MKWVLASDQSTVKSWLVQPIKELSSAAGRCARRGCALIRQLAKGLYIEDNDYNAFEVKIEWTPRSEYPGYAYAYGPMHR